METKSIEFKGSTIKAIGGHPADPEPTVVLTLTAPLTVAVADALKCRDMAYTVNDNARQFEGAFGLPLEIGENECEISFESPGFGKRTLRPFKVWKFRISHLTDLMLSVDFRAHLKGASDGQVIFDLLQDVNQDSFMLELASMQGELFPERPAGTGEGTRVDMSEDSDQETLFDKPKSEKPKKESSGCKNCDAGIPRKDNDDAEHVNGEACKLWDRPLNPPPPMETAVLTNAAPFQYEPTTEVPDGNGVYLCDPTVAFERKFGKLFGSIEALMIGPDEWVSALTIEAPKLLQCGQLRNDETYTSLDVAVAVKACEGEDIARAQINLYKGAVALSWLELAGWFQQQWVSRREALDFETVEEWGAYLAGMLSDPETAGAVN